MQHQSEGKSFLCQRCGRIYFSRKKYAPCPACKTKNKAYQVKPIYCPYCGGTAYLKHKSEVFSDDKLERYQSMRSEYLYVCKNYPECDSFVWTHPATQIPYGHLANAELRKKRIWAHDCISTIVRLRIMSKNKTYYWLSTCLGYSSKQMHISQMNDTICEQVIDLSLKAIKQKSEAEYNRLVSKINK